ncbi:hypothetical protein ES332_A07G224700v1 [Gossypium tomentosum]|uniref:Uncharacterized protein n=1 Tax=Gossypium tomentosum TaxID=34277 RepID=A0A5D2PVL1_GOSTO|nr:hypothetical protein ES332_A07G224700v1 [Gossypium tomentosum]
MQSEARGVYGVARVEECEATARGELIPGEAAAQTFLGFQFLKPKFRALGLARNSADRRRGSSPYTAAGKVVVQVAREP